MDESRCLHMSVQAAITVAADAQVRELGGSEHTHLGLSFVRFRLAKQTTFRSHYQPLSFQTSLAHELSYALEL